MADLTDPFPFTDGAFDDVIAGFRITVVSEPQPEPEARALFPEDFELLPTAPSFLFFVLQSV